jgi:hypothetical protein
MAGEAVFDGSDEQVMELVLSSDDEFTGAVPHSVEDGRLRRHELRERFLPGVDGGALLALGVSLVSLTSSGLIEILAQNREFSESFNRSGQNTSDPWAPFRQMNQMRFLGQGAFALVAVIIAALAAANWRSERHARWSRPVAQAALLLGLAGLAIAVLGYFDVIGALPKAPDGLLQDGSGQG